MVTTTSVYYIHSTGRLPVPGYRYNIPLDTLWVILETMFQVPSQSLDSYKKLVFHLAATVLLKPNVTTTK